MARGSALLLTVFLFRANPEVLQSDFYFQFKGGGMHPFAEFSDLNFYIQKVFYNEVWCSRKKSLFFHNSNQISVKGNDINLIYKKFKINETANSN